MPIKAIFFDLDDTLINDTESSEHWAEVAARDEAGHLGLDPKDLAEAYLHAAIDFWERLEPGAGRPLPGDIRPSMWYEALKSRGVDDRELARRAAKHYDAIRLEGLELYPDAVPVLKQLHGRYHLAIITNGFAETHEKKIEHLGLVKFFDNVILAGEMDLIKPDPAVFRHAMEVADVGPEESVMVGDRYNRDILGAHAAGMRAILIKVWDEPIPNGARPPEATIDSIGELPQALAQLENHHE